MSRQSHGSSPPPYPHAEEPWATYFLHHNPGWWKPTDGYSRWKLGSSRKWTAISIWELREKARLKYVASYGDDPEQWPERHLTVVVFATMNAPDAVCIECLWIDGSHWEERGARTAGRLHTATEELARQRGECDELPGQPSAPVQP